jgi:endonuclease/exonuclease/phosphatase family metal-dependent hydrolase
MSTFRSCVPVLRAAALILTCAVTLGCQSAEGPKVAAVSLTVATFNLRYASAKQPNSWPERRPVMQECFRRMDADIVGTQEGLYPQLKDIAADLPEYDWIGLGREGGSRGEFMAVFFRRSRLEPLEFDHFWLSDTPEVIASATWGNTTRRMVTWIRFRERPSGREFYVFNTHLDNAKVVAREKGAALIRERVARIVTNGLPVLLIGDFNAMPTGEKTYPLLTEGGFFTDAWVSAPVRRNEGLNTFHDFRGAQKGDFRIDWILLRGLWECSSAEVFLHSRNGQFPSDHHPVVAQLRLPAIGD